MEMTLAPCAPVDPVAPLAPLAPVAPDAPLAPVAPVEPLAPVDPLAPLAPVAPLAPCAPTAPVAPDAPVAPVAPLAPVAPVAPDAPVAPTEPFEEKVGTPLSLAPPEPDRRLRGWRARRAANQAADEARERRERPRRGLGRRRGRPPAVPSGRAIEIRGLVHTWPDGTPGLAGVDLTVEAGERVAVLGANGSGKTTLAMHLVGGLEPGAGAVTVGGTPVARPHLAEVRRRVGLVFQDPDDQLLLPTVAADVALAPRNQGLAADDVSARVTAALDVVGLTDAAERAPEHLSLGERRRVALAGVLAAHPEVLVLDEPTANLDPASRRDLIEVIRGLDLTTVVITHDLPVALELCPRSVVIAHGRVAADGATAALFANPSLLAAHRLELPYRMVAPRPT
jgi:cobalt/nickel transport system ATP-binding protein